MLTIILHDYHLTQHSKQITLPYKTRPANQLTIKIRCNAFVYPIQLTMVILILKLKFKNT